MLLFNADELDERFDRARNTAGVALIREAQEVQHPAGRGTAVIGVRVSMLTEPDGFIFERNRLLGGLR